MKKFILFMVLIKVFMMGFIAPNTENSTNSAGWVWCTENPKDCATYWVEKALNETKLVGGMFWNGTKLTCRKNWDDIVTLLKSDMQCKMAGAKNESKAGATTQ